MANTVINTPELLNLDSTAGATVLAKGATSTRPTSPALSLDYLVVAGGGGTSNDSPGGGGAGGLRTSYGSNSGGGNSNEPNLALNSGVAYTITVGGGGAANTAGSSSVFDSITSAGGGRGSGGGTSYTAGAGGSGGGGAGGSYNNAGGSGTSNQGFAGGTSGGSGSGATYPGGGGGGASAAGVSTVNGGAGGNGGAGLAVNILNATNAAAASVGEVDSSNVYYAGGGGGTSSSPQGTGGTGGGGDGGGTNNGAANTGGGGGGTNATGGSGVVILRYPTADVSSFTVTGTLNTPSAGAQTQFTEGSDTIIVFKQGTGTITFSIPQEESDAVDGTLRFNTDTNKTEYFDSANWYEIVDEYANGYDGIPTNYFDTKLYTGNNATQSIGGYINGSASFNGSSSKIDLPNNILPNNSTASSSCSFWFKSSSGNSTGDSETIIDAWSYSTSEPGWGLFMEPAYGGFPDGQLYLANYYLGGTSGGTGNVTFRDGNWHFGVVVLDFTGGTIKVYIDGNSTPVLSQTVSSANVDVFTTNAAIGYQNANPSYPRHFNGAIDQVRIYSDALTTSEIAYLYANENSTTAGQLNPSGFPTNCVAAYTMDTSANGILNTQDLSTVDYPAGTGCIALYEMNGNSNDTSGAYNGTPVSLSYQGGAFDQAASFDGSNSKITLSSTISGIKTYSFWINPNSSGNATYARRLFGDVGGTSYTNSITFDKPNSKVTYFEGTSARSSDTISNDTWSHIAFTSDGTTLKVYTNGSLSNTYTTSAFVSSIDEICSTASNRQFNGLIDQVRIFNTALSDANIATLARGAGTAYNGTWNGTEQYTPGRFDQAAKFTNDSTSWIDLLNTSTSVFSCSVWVKLDELGTTAQYIIGNSIEPSHPNDKNFNLYYRGDYNLNQFSFQSSEGYVGFGPTIQANRWYHVCWSGNNGTLTKVWVDGQEQSLPTVTRTFDSSGEWRVGVWRYRNSSNTLLSAHPLRGSVDQVRIFSTALLNNQVTDLYNEHYQTKFTDGSDTAIMFTQGTGTVTFNGINANAPQGAIRANTSHSEDGSSSVIEHYNGTAWKYFDAVKYCTTNTLNFPTGAGCVASYNLNNNVNDIENAYIGTNYNVTFNASGKFGAAGEFNGSNAFVDSGFTALSSTKASISFWVNIAAYTNYGGFVGDSTGQSKASRFFLGQGSGTSGNLWVSLGNGTTQWYDDTTVSLASYGLNNWFHLVGTVDGTSVKIYINGSLIHTFTSSISYAGAGTFPYYFGGWGSALLLNGELDQIRFFTTALTLAQVQDLYYNEVAC